MPTLKPVKDGSLRSQVTRILRQAIFSGEIAPGVQLLEIDLAAQLQVSQTTVREALVQLEQVGLVVRVPNKRTSVSALSEKEVRHRLAIRFVLEGLAWVMAAERMTAENFRELEELLDEIRQVPSLSPEKTEAELNFHHYIWKQSGNPILFQMLEQLTPPVFAYINLRRKTKPRNVKKLDRAHQQVLNVLKTRDRNQIIATLHEHLEASYGSLLKAAATDVKDLFYATSEAGGVLGISPP